MNVINFPGHFAQNPNIYSILGEPEDPNSDWSELRCAQLSGYDYIFVSSTIKSKLNNRTALSEFLIEVYQLLDTSHERARLYIYSDCMLNLPEFSALEVSWKGAHIRDIQIDPVTSNEQKEFIKTMYDHSGMLVGVA